jgi:hypothetical protein
VKSALRTTVLCLATGTAAAWAARAQSPAVAVSPTPVSTVLPASAVLDAPLVHVVLFDLTEGATADDARALADDSRRLLRDIPGVESVWAGPKAVADRDVHVKDYDVALCVRLRSLADLKAYAMHPQHRELVEKWKTRATWRVVDFADSDL